MPHLKRFYDESLVDGAKSATLSGDEFHHLKNVLRVSAGSRVALFNGKGLEAEGIVEEIGRDIATISIESINDMNGLRESFARIALLQGLLKGDKNELVVQKATELGVTEVSFFGGGRAVPSTGDEEGGRLRRFKRAAIEAAKQSGRSVLPQVNVFPDAKAACAGRSDALKIVLWEDEAGMHLNDLLDKSARSVSLLVGPEGGFSPDDIREAAAAGFKPAGLGPRRLRAETAAIAAVAIAGFVIGDLSRSG